LVLVEPPVVEPAKPPRSLGAESTLGGEPALETEAVEAIRARGNGNGVSDLKWREKSLTSRNEIELEAIAALETAVDRRHEIAVALPTAGESRDIAELILPKALSDVQRSNGLIGPRLPIGADICDVYTGPRHEA